MIYYDLRNRQFTIFSDMHVYTYIGYGCPYGVVHTTYTHGGYTFPGFYNNTPYASTNNKRIT